MTKHYYRKSLFSEKRSYTRGTFVGWTEPTGLLDCPYAMFERKSDTLFVPHYLVAKETQKVLPRPKKW